MGLEAGEAGQVLKLPKRNHQLIICDFGIATLHTLKDRDHLPIQVHVENARLPYLHAGQQLTQRRHRIARRDRAGGNLGQQWLENEVVNLVYLLDVGAIA
jgi:hypothetical protein